MTTKPHNLGLELAAAHQGRFRIVAYDELRRLATVVATQILRRYGTTRSGIVVAQILMGGGVPARLVIDALLPSGIVAEIVPCRIQRYSGVGTAGEAVLSVRLAKRQVAGRVVIGIDDLVDGGQTLIAFVEHARAQGAARVETATLFAKPSSIVTPDYCGEKGVDEWLVLPGEECDFMSELRTLEPAVGRLEAGELSAYFEALGFRPEVVSDWMRLVAMYNES
jgi:hypoxanthine-guanine phosphoribosyltransferase